MRFLNIMVFSTLKASIIMAEVLRAAILVGVSMMMLTAASVESEKHALLKSGWWFSYLSRSEESNHCSWPGITCNVNGSITKMIGDYNQDIGRFGAMNFDSLPNLVWLDLSSQGLEGSIPSQLAFGSLPSLKHLDLSGNYLSGSILPQLGSPSLMYLDLSDNYLSGSIPPELESLSSLKHLDLSKNNLSGNNNLSGPYILGLPPSLAYLNLGVNPLNGVSL